MARRDETRREEKRGEEKRDVAEEHELRMAVMNHFGGQFGEESGLMYPGTCSWNPV